MSSTLRFYEQLVPLTDFRQIIEGDGFVAAPDDWAVVMSDVKGSTKAIQDGRYRDVNMLGASGITAVLNALGDVDIPYIFGGDGATLLVPEAQLDKVIDALKGTQKMSRDLFKLELRVGAVPIRTLRQNGAEVAVAKYELSPGNSLAQFRGGGIARAEEILKSGKENPIQPDADTADPDLTGLSCRWEPFGSKKGTMMTFLAIERGPFDPKHVLYADLVQNIERIVGGDLKTASPVTASGMKGKFPMSVLREAKVHSSGRLRLKPLLRAAAFQLFTHFLVRFNISFAGFEPTRYRREVAMNADFKKFDDMLRMVVDCTLDQAENIEMLLIALHQEGKIFYGVHRSPQAVMTCLVISASENQHVHFVDGSHGGYAMAAKSMKAQMGKGA